MYFYLKCAVIFLLLIRTVYTDIRKDRIENKALAFSIICGFGIMLLFGETKDLLQGIEMAVVVTLVLFLLFLLKGLGAGDIKLLAVIALYFPKSGIPITGISFIVAGIIALGRMVLRKIRKKEVIIRGETLHFSVPIAIAVMFVLGTSYL